MLLNYVNITVAVHRLFTRKLVFPIFIKIININKKPFLFNLYDSNYYIILL